MFFSEWFLFSLTFRESFSVLSLLNNLTNGLEFHNHQKTWCAIRVIRALCVKSFGEPYVPYVAKKLTSHTR